MQYQKEYFETNKERLAAKKREYRAKNREHHNALQRDWVARNKTRARAIDRCQMARRKTKFAEGVDSETLAAWTLSQPKVCFYCTADCAGSFHVDHFMPLAKGGAHVLTNLRIACPPCNLRKNARDPMEFMERAA